MKRVCVVLEFGPCGVGYLRGGVLPHAVCLWLVRVSWGVGTLAEALIDGMRRDGCGGPVHRRRRAAAK